MIDRALDEAERTPEILTLSSGAVVRAKPVPDNMILLLRKQNPPPEPPMVEIDSGGKQWREPNPNDPKYLEDLDSYKIELGNAMTDMILLMGLEILELPQGVVDFDEDETWQEELEAVNLRIPEKSAARKLMWLRYRIAPSSSDLAAISEAYGATVGVSEEDVQAKQALFRRSPGRRAGGELDQAAVKPDLQSRA